MAGLQSETSFERARALVWVCDLEGSSSTLNRADTVERAELFLQRFFWLSSLMMRSTDAAVAKWTGDGFMAAYSVALDREMESTARRLVEAAYYLSLIVNLTQLDVRMSVPMRVRHGMAYEPDAIMVRHVIGSDRSTDLIGRGVVLAFRLSGIPGAFPHIVLHDRVAAAATDAGSEHRFKQRKLSNREVLKYFKGEKRSTASLFTVVDAATDKLSPRALSRRASEALKRIESRDPKESVGKEWLNPFLDGLETGPEWAQAVRATFLGYTNNIVGLLKAVGPAVITLIESQATRQPPNAGSRKPRSD